MTEILIWYWHLPNAAVSYKQTNTRKVNAIFNLFKAYIQYPDQLTAKWYLVCTLDGNMDYTILVNSKPNAKEFKEIDPGQTGDLKARRYVRWFIQTKKPELSYKIQTK